SRSRAPIRPPRPTLPLSRKRSPPPERGTFRRPPTCNARSAIRWRASLWNGRSCAARRAKASSSAAMSLSFREIRAGRRLACCAVIAKAANAKALLDALPAEARRDPGYVFSRVQLLRRAEKAGEAAELMLSLPQNEAHVIDADQWWVERRLVVRKLLDAGDAKTAYRLARDAALPSRENYRVDQQFTSGWIALRFLNDPAAALAHFAKVAHINNN